MMKFFLPLIFVACAPFFEAASVTKYQRKHWNHWTDKDRDCQNTRHEILIARSLSSVSFDRKGCKVMRGKWEDYYFPEVHTVASFVDIDHLVPLKHAHLTGGAGWSRKKKEEFANDPENLVITNKKYNREKGQKGIDQWLPAGRDYACKFIKDWVKIKNKYQLEIKENEKRTIDVAKCDS